MAKKGKKYLSIEELEKMINTERTERDARQEVLLAKQKDCDTDASKFSELLNMAKDDKLVGVLGAVTGEKFIVKDEKVMTGENGVVTPDPSIKAEVDSRKQACMDR